jgi:hypothetical protein
MNLKPSLLLLAALMSSREAFAGDAAAEALFRAGREATDKGDHRTACLRFEESHRLEPASGTVFNLALCLERLGQVASAWRRFREAKERLPSGDERSRMADERIAALEPRLPKLTLRLSEPDAKATIVRDGVELGRGSLGVAVPVDPGGHEVVVRAPGREERRLEVELAEGESKELVVDVGAPTEVPTTRDEERGKEAAPPSKPPEPSGTEGSSRTLAYAVGGVGVVGLGVGLVAGGLALGRKNVVDRECAGDVCSREGVDAANSGRTLSTLSTVAVSIGLVGAGVGAYLLLTAEDSAERAELRMRAAPGTASLELGGTF